MCNDDPGPLFEHNKVCYSNDVYSLIAFTDQKKHYLMRAYPRGLRISSSNFSPLHFWKAGVQIVALNWQRYDAGLMINTAMFAGSQGWQLKPSYMFQYEEKSGLRSKSIASDIKLSISFIMGMNIHTDSAEEEIANGGNKVYVNCYLHTVQSEKPNLACARVQDTELKTKTAKGMNPYFDYEKLEFPKAISVMTELSFVRCVNVFSHGLPKHLCPPKIKQRLRFNHFILRYHIQMHFLFNLEVSCISLFPFTFLLGLGASSPFLTPNDLLTFCYCTGCSIAVSYSKFSNLVSCH